MKACSHVCRVAAGRVHDLVEQSRWALFRTLVLGALASIWLAFG